MLGTKSKFSIALQSLTDCQTEVVHEFALLSFASHVHVKSDHKLHKKIMDRIFQNSVHYKIRIDNRKLFKTLMLVMLFYLLTVLIRFKS